MRLLSFALSLVMLASAAVAAGCRSPKASGPTRITLGFTAWPGWLPWEVAKEQGLFAKNGLNVELKYFTNYTGNDKIIARDGITSVADLKGRKVAIVQGTVDHYLLLLALGQAGLGQQDVVLDPQSTNAAAATAFAGGQVDAVSASAPFTTKALQRPGSHAIATSAEFPGAIPNHLVVRPALIHDHPEAVQALVDTWFDTLRWIKSHKDTAVAIMARTSGVGVDDYQTFDAGTTIFTRRQNLDAFTPGTTPQHLNFQAALIADFVFGTGMVQNRPSLAGLLDERFVKSVPD